MQKTRKLRINLDHLFLSFYWESSSLNQQVCHKYFQACFHKYYALQKYVCFPSSILYWIIAEGNSRSWQNNTSPIFLSIFTQSVKTKYPIIWAINHFRRIASTNPLYDDRRVNRGTSGYKMHHKSAEILLVN